MAGIFYAYAGYSATVWHLAPLQLRCQVRCLAGELILHREGHEAISVAVGGLYWRYEQWIRKCEGKIDSLVGDYGVFISMRRGLGIEPQSSRLFEFMPKNYLWRCVSNSRARYRGRELRLDLVARPSGRRPTSWKWD